LEQSTTPSEEKESGSDAENPEKRQKVEMSEQEKSLRRELE